ncbi:MAG: Rne/Rng family ribonuclease, partial [Fervidobacterium sp.]
MILILRKDNKSEKTDAALIENGLLSEIFFYEEDEESIAGSIYVGKIEKFVPALDAFFVKISSDENGFLRVKDVKNEYLTSFNLKKIQEGQKILVQVKKEGGYLKGPQVTTNIGIPGRCIVYMPFSKTVGISRKITSKEEREKLKKIGEILKEKYESGFIIRTNAVECSEDRIFQEAEEIDKRWKNILDTFKRAKKTKLIYREEDIDEYIVREFLRNEVKEVITNSMTIKDLVRKYRKDIYVKVSEDDPFEEYGVYKQLEKSLSRVHELPSGGQIVIDKSEAFTIIDVNSGHFTQIEDHEELSKTINVEAAKEICRLLRLRNIGGIIIIDFIDMKDDENRKEVLNTLKNEILKDRNRIELYGFTQLGLFEMARKRVSRSLDERFTTPCPVCSGSGHVFNPKYVIERLMSEVKSKPKNAKEAIVKLHPSFKSVLDKEELKKIL